MEKRIQFLFSFFLEEIMKKVVDLSVFDRQTLAMKMPTGEVLQIRKPTQQMVIEMMKFREINENSDVATIVMAMDAMVLAILNSNEKMIVFTQEELDDMLNLDMKTVIIQEYGNFLRGIQQNPN